MAKTLDKDLDSLYHVVFTISHLSHDVFAEVEKVRVAGTYTSLKAAKAAAHRLIFDAGYEVEWFTEYLTQPAEFEEHKIDHHEGLMVYAKARDGTTFRVTLLTAPNSKGFESDEEGKIDRPLYHVLQMNVKYSIDDSGATRETNIEGSFDSYEEARRYASELLLSEDEGITRDSFAQYDEAKAPERDCGYGENVIVHAVGNDGDNILISVLKEQEMEAARLAEAAMRIR